MTMDLHTALDTLARHRDHSTRASQETFDAGAIILQNNAVGKLGDDSWTFLEQLTLAAIDIGRLDVADTCLKLLTDKFPGSPRMGALTGIRIEASEGLEVALKYYEDALQEDPINVAVWKRQISVLRRLGKTERAVTELSEFLDTFYTDVEGWLELADIYSSSNQHTYALQSLSHVLLLVPQNPFYALQFAEIAYVAGDVPLACKMFLQVVSMTDGEDGDAAHRPPEGLTIRAWYGVRLCTNRLIKDAKVASTSASKTALPAHANVLLSLSRERLEMTEASEKQKTIDSMPPSWSNEIRKGDVLLTTA